jgi:RND superfamily putative drug exporter
MRFRDELNSYDKDDAMVNTFDAVFTPMCITTIAAIIGCLCLHLSRLTSLGDMGTILAMGVLFCMIAAVTILPVVLVLLTREKKQGVTMSASA